MSQPDHGLEQFIEETVRQRYQDFITLHRPTSYVENFPAEIIPPIIAASKTRAQANLLIDCIFQLITTNERMRADGYHSGHVSDPGAIGRYCETERTNALLFAEDPAKLAQAIVLQEENAAIKPEDVIDVMSLKGISKPLTAS